MVVVSCALLINRQLMMEDISEEPLSCTKLIDALNEGIIKCIQSSGNVLPSSCVKRNSQFDCQWTEYVSILDADESLSCSPVVEDLRQFVDVLRDTVSEHDYIGTDGRPIFYATCLGLLMSKRESNKNNNNSNSTPLSTFLEIAEFLEDELDVDLNQPTETEGACHRPPIHLLARACHPEALGFLIERHADENSTDDEGWTALMACCLPDIPSEEEGGPSDKERVDTVKVLMNDSSWGEREYISELEINAQNYCGSTAMHYACEGLNAALIQCLLDGAEYIAKVDLTLKTIWGETALGIVRSHREDNPEKAARCEAILMSRIHKIPKSDPIHDYLEDEQKAIELVDLINDVLIPASRGDEDSSDGVKVESGRLAAQDRRIITSILDHLNLDPALVFEQNSCQQYNNEGMNIYETIYQHICDLIPSALIKVYCNTNPTHEERGIVTCTNYNLRKSSERSENGARLIDTSALMSQAFCLHRQRGHVARQIEVLTSLFVGPLQRTFSFAIPSNEVIRQIIEIAPRIVEVGAGTGYWSHLLSNSGADIVAYDASPPGHQHETSYSGDNVYFGGLSYYPVQYGVASTIFDGSSDVAERALLMVWPNNPDAVDNPHVAVAAESLPEVWDFECVQKYYEMGGKIVIFVGERKDSIQLMKNATHPDWGFCASRKFQEFLDSNYVLKATLKCPQWWLKADDVTIWERED